MSTVIGVDVGGTFTDFFILDTASGAASVFKTSSTPANPALAIASGLRAILESAWPTRRPSPVSRTGRRWVRTRSSSARAPMSR